MDDLRYDSVSAGSPVQCHCGKNLLYNLVLNLCTQRFFYAFKGSACIEDLEKGEVAGEVLFRVFFAGEFYPDSDVELVLCRSYIGI